MVNHHIATSKDEALMLMNQNTYRLIAGGTDYIIQNKQGAGVPVQTDKPLLFIGDLDELRGIAVEKDTITIGAATPLQTVLDHPLIPKMVQEIVVKMAAPAIRHTATLGGNIQNASPAGDSLLFLYLLNATLVLERLGSTRKMLIEDFITGPRKTDLKPNELITKIIIDHPRFTMHSFAKAGGRKADAISKLNFLGAFSTDKKRIVDFRVCFGAIYKTIIRDKPFESSFVNQSTAKIKKEKDDILNHYATLIKPIDDQRSSAVYRKKAALRLLSAFLDDIV